MLFYLELKFLLKEFNEAYGLNYLNDLFI